MTRRATDSTDWASRWTRLGLRRPNVEESVRGGGAEIRAEEEKQQREVEKILR